ncbi:unnamed protein product [Rhizophagus irregularis]|nr:unnamed protein product [Rhizophagus irregularis]
MSQEFIDQLYRYHKCLQSEALADCFGITKDPTSCYIFGMIMWMLSAGVRPYCDRPHDKQLVQEICSGLRPSNIDGTPPVYASLMLQCLDANPLKRPTVSQICEYLGNWTSNLSNQFEEEYVNLEKLNLWSLPCHEKAIYFSRLLDF